MRTLDQGSTGGLPPGRQDRLRACRPKGEAQRAESIPPSPPYLKKEPELTLRLFCVYMPQPGRQVRFAYLPYTHPAQRFCRVGKRQRTHRLSRKPDGRCAPLICPTYIQRNSSVGWISIGAPTFWPQRNHKDKKKAQHRLGFSDRQNGFNRRR